MSIFSSYMNTLQKRYATFSGRASRREYASFMILMWGVRLAFRLAFLLFVNEDDTLSKVIMGLAVIVGLTNIIPGLALSVRRLHDLDTSGWWLLGLPLIFFIFVPSPILGALFVLLFIIFLGFMQGSPEKNDYGNPPARKDNVANTHWIFLALACLNFINIIARDRPKPASDGAPRACMQTLLR